MIMNIRTLSLVLGASLIFQSTLPAFAAETTNASATISGNTVLRTASYDAPWQEADGHAALEQLLSQKQVSALVYLCEQYEVKAAPDESGDVVTTVPSGQQVFIQDYALNDGFIWYKISCFVSDQEYEGYISQQNLAYSDEDFLAWEAAYLGSYTVALYSSDGNYADVAQFPASYQGALNQLKAAHPNWTFVKFNTNLDWNTVIASEDVMVNGEPRNAITSSAPAAWKSGEWTRNWSRASADAIKYYMDPRNFLNETYIFQFEQLTYNASYHSTAAVQNILNSSFMAGGIPGDSRTYAQAFWEIGSSLGVSPFHLACRVYQEQGANGTSPLISGTYPGYENLYNYYNIGATGSSDAAIIANGLTRARKEGWTTRYSALSGGAQILSRNYILKGQDTLYLQKFDVDSSANGLYYHQYMQNIKAPCLEGNSIRKAYTNAGALNNSFVFKIPVYDNMPAAACPEPGTAPAPAFTDVPPNAYYTAPVNWAVQKGITTGTSTTTFSPEKDCTRAQIVTFLWRRAGSPEPNSANNPFTDISSQAYYYKAVLWAVERGITTGTSTTTFSPEAVCTRAQSVTFLYRYAGRPAAAAGANPFTDINSTAYYYQPVLWAVEKGITTGTSTTTFSPETNCTRAQIVTFLYRQAN